MSDNNKNDKKKKQYPINITKKEMLNPWFWIRIAIMNFPYIAWCTKNDGLFQFSVNLLLFGLPLSAVLERWINKFLGDD